MEKRTAVCIVVGIILLGGLGYIIYVDPDPLNIYYDDKSTQHFNCIVIISSSESTSTAVKWSLSPIFLDDRNKIFNSYQPPFDCSEEFLNATILYLEITTIDETTTDETTTGGVGGTLPTNLQNQN